MNSKTIGSNCRTKEDVEVLIKTYSETGVKTNKGNDIALLCINLVIFALGEPFIDLIDPAGTGIGVNIECADLALAQMEISAIIERCGYCIHITGSVVVVLIVITNHETGGAFVVYIHTTRNPVTAIIDTHITSRCELGTEVIFLLCCYLTTVGLGMGAHRKNCA